jgi:hypothetical protein
VFGEEFRSHLGRSCPLPHELPFHKIVDWDATAGHAYDPTYDQKQPTGPERVARGSVRDPGMRAGYG